MAKNKSFQVTATSTKSKNVLLTADQALTRQNKAHSKVMKSELSLMLNHTRVAAVHSDSRTKRIKSRSAAKRFAISQY